MKTLEKVVEEHLLFDPQDSNPLELTKYGEVYIINKIMDFDPIDPDRFEPSIIHIKPYYENEIFLNQLTEVLIIIEKDKVFSFHKLSREDLKDHYKD